MMPMREPIRSLLYVAADRAVRDVYVDGERVVADGRAINLDYQAASEALEEAQKRSMREVPKRDWAATPPSSLPLSSSPSWGQDDLFEPKAGFRPDGLPNSVRAR